MKPNKLLVCSTCDYGQYRGAQDFIQNIQASLDYANLQDLFDVEEVECMGACEMPVTIAFLGKDKACFVFSGVNPDEDIADIVSTGQTYLKSPKGLIDDARPCGRLRDLLRSRVPAFDHD